MLSRELAATLNIKVAPGTRVASSDDVRSFVEHPGVGYPVMIKALDGGGGRGIRIVGQQSDVDEAFRRYEMKMPISRSELDLLLPLGVWEKAPQVRSSLRRL
jgi:biotin carboxylase